VWRGGRNKSSPCLCQAEATISGLRHSGAGADKSTAGEGPNPFLEKDRALLGSD